MSPSEISNLSFGFAVLVVVLGILSSLILPVAVNYLKNNTLESTIWQKLKKAWRQYNGKRYLLIVLAASVVGIILILVFNMQFTSFRDAFMVGFAWESLVSKVFGQNSG